MTPRMGDELPARPRLAPNVWARRHWVDSEEIIVVRGPGFSGVLKLGDAAWEALTLADGTRDLEGLQAACAREGVSWTLEELHELLGELHELGFVVHGPVSFDDGVLSGGGEEMNEVAPPEAEEVRPLEPLVGFSFACDGSGSCCRFYDSIAFRAEEGQLARLITNGGPTEDLFTPTLGAQLDRSSWTPMMNNGRCAFLDEGGSCAIHRLGGYPRKPVGCRVYPRNMIDDGVAVRVSVAPECKCVFDSALHRGGEPLVSPQAKSIEALGDEAIVPTLPQRIVVGGSKEVDRAELRAFSVWLDGWLRETDADLAAAAWHLADVLEEQGLVTSFDAVPALPEEAKTWLAWLGRAARGCTADESAWRSTSDLHLRALRWLADALESPGSPTPSPSAERWYLLSLNHTYRLTTAPRPLAHGLRDRAVRMLAARAMRETAPGFEDPTTSHPLAMLEALLRDTRLSRYAPSD